MARVPTVTTSSQDEGSWLQRRNRRAWRMLLQSGGELGQQFMPGGNNSNQLIRRHKQAYDVQLGTGENQGLQGVGLQPEALADRLLEKHSQPAAQIETKSENIDLRISCIVEARQERNTVSVWKTGKTHAPQSSCSRRGASVQIHKMLQNGIVSSTEALLTLRRLAVPPPTV
eukprot:502905-Pelagomonas_calceolata.AAC.4